MLPLLQAVCDMFLRLCSIKLVRSIKRRCAISTLAISSYRLRSPPAQIKKLREANNVSQPVFARYLNTSESTVEKWETGAKRPSGMALKLRAIVQKHGLGILT